MHTFGTLLAQGQRMRLGVVSRDFNAAPVAWTHDETGPKNPGMDSFFDMTDNQVWVRFPRFGPYFGMVW